MLNIETRKEINYLINNIEASEYRLSCLIERDFNGTCDQWDEIWSRAIDSHNRSIDRLAVKIDILWYRNLCLKVQKSLNYYLKKAGLKPYKITARI
jgi:hypothetical protein